VTTTLNNRQIFFAAEADQFAIAWILADSMANRGIFPPGATPDQLSCALHLMGLVTTSSTPNRRLSFRTMERRTRWSRQFCMKVCQMLCDAELLIRCERESKGGSDAYVPGPAFDGPDYREHIAFWEENWEAMKLTWPTNNRMHSISLKAKQKRAKAKAANQGVVTAEITTPSDQPQNQGVVTAGTTGVVTAEITRGVVTAETTTPVTAETTTLIVLETPSLEINEISKKEHRPETTPHPLDPQQPTATTAESQEDSDLSSDVDQTVQARASFEPWQQSAKPTGHPSGRCSLSLVTSPAGSALRTAPHQENHAMPKLINGCQNPLNVECGEHLMLKDQTVVVRGFDWETDEYTVESIETGEMQRVDAKHLSIVVPVS